MTEYEWLATTDAVAMLAHLKTVAQLFPNGQPSRATDRRLRYFGRACAHAKPLQGSHKIYDPFVACEGWHSGVLQRFLAGNRASPGYENADAWCSLYSKDLRMGLAVLLREVFGNPFRLVVVVTPIPTAGGYYHRKTDGRLLSIGEVGKIKMFAHDWLTPTVTAIAQSMWDADDFSDVGILGDALEEAGCTNPDVLGHCRLPLPDHDPTPWEHRERADNSVATMQAEMHARLYKPAHVRGCWVVDLVLDNL